MNFSKEITNACKGVEILMLLAHHLWGSLSQDVCPQMLVSIGKSGKMCVAFFVLLSGYGLAKAGCDWQKTLARRIPKLLWNYWFIVAVFVPISIFGFGISFDQAYPNDTWWQFPLQLFGLNWIAPTRGFNPTWWFMNAIVPHYLLSPILMRLIKWNVFIALIGAFALSGARFCICPQITSPFFGHHVVFVPLLWSFVIGMVCARYDIFNKINDKVGRRGLLMGALAMVGFYFRINALMDGFIAFIFCVSVFAVCGVNWIKIVLSFLGVHSMNIFYVHTFYRCIWFGGGFFSNLNPALSFVLLLAVSLLTSFALNILKTTCLWSCEYCGILPRNNRGGSCDTVQ